MLTELPSIQSLPHQNATQVKNKWGDVVRLVHQSGTVAITNHSSIEMVLLDAGRYQQLVDEIQVLRSRDQTVLNELADRFDAQLAVLQQPAAAANARALFKAKGKSDKRPKAGASY